MLATVLATLPAAREVAVRAVPGAGVDTALLVVSILLIGVTTVAYTLLGGMTAVIWTDVIQLLVYLTGAVLAAAILLTEIPGGWSEIVATAGPQGSSRCSTSRGADSELYLLVRTHRRIFLTAATHGTDQLFVQRYLCSRSVAQAQRALIMSGVVILVQFGLFLIIGTMLWVYYTGYAPEVLATLTVGRPFRPTAYFPRS